MCGGHGCAVAIISDMAIISDTAMISDAAMMRESRETRMGLGADPVGESTESDSLGPVQTRLEQQQQQQTRQTQLAQRSCSGARARDALV